MVLRAGTNLISLSPYNKRPRRAQFLPCEDTASKGGDFMPGRELSAEPTYAGTLILNFQPLEP